MKYWKLGCRWGSKSDGLPLFLDLLLENQIVISWIDRDFGESNYVLLTDGFKPIGIAVTKSERRSISELKHLEDAFNDREVYYDDRLFYYDAEVYEINNPTFSFDYQKGISKINQESTRKEILRAYRAIITEFEMNKKLELLNYKKQIILQGPPGTGKTRQAKLIAKEILGVDDVKELDKHPQFEIVQFHPSYSYEDFVEGMKPDLVDDKLTYAVKPGILKGMATKALAAYLNIAEQEQYDNSFDQLFSEFVSTLKNLDEENPTIFTTKSGIEIYFHSASDQVINVIYRYSDRDKKEAGTHIFKLSKQKFQQLLDKQVDPNNIKSLRSAIKPTTKFHQSEYYAVYKELYTFIQSKNIELDTITSEEDDYVTICEAYLALDDKNKNKEVEKFILVIDEINRANLSTVLGELIYALEYRGSKVKSIYREDECSSLILPPNLYIIGTMNTADRSVGHIDYAIRRRFAFVDVEPKVLESNDEMIFNSELFNKVSKLIEEYQTQEFPLKDIQLGHSYFIQKRSRDENNNEVLTPVDMHLRLDFEIKPILREYVKDGILRAEAESKINELGQTQN